MLLNVITVVINLEHSTTTCIKPFFIVVPFYAQKDREVLSLRLTPCVCITLSFFNSVYRFSGNLE
jgi:hypothetical protein